jgi:hypothetical protein
MSSLHLRIGHASEADQLVRRFHYSKRPPANVQIVATLHDDGGLFGDYGDAVAACYLCIPPTRWSEAVLELARLVRVDRRIVLTPLIAAACDAAKRQGHDLLVSFADRTQGHHGGIYQAASWAYAGCRDRNMDGVILDGVFLPGRSCNSRWGTRSPRKLTEILGRDVFPHFDEGKHLYWRGLGSRGNAKAKRLGLDRLPYPKPATVQTEAAA